MRSLEKLCGSKTIRWVGLIVGCLNIATSGSMMAINSYANDIKNVFNLTQSNVELILAFGGVGASVGPPIGYFLEKCGPPVGFLSAMIAGTGSSMLIFSARYNVHFYHDHYGLLALYFFILGMATLMMYLASMYVNMINFKKRHRGKIVGITGGSWFLGPAIFAAIYTSVFEKTQEIGYFFLLTAVVMFVVNLMAAVFLRDYSHLVDPSQNEDQNLVLEVTDGGIPPETESHSDSITGFELLRKLDFHILSWAFFCSASVQVLIMANVAVYLKSFNLVKMTTALVITGPIIAASTKISTGFISDYYVMSLPRSAYISVGTFLQTIILLFCIKFAENAGLFVITVLLTYVCNALYFSLFPALLSEIFGMKYFSRNWGGLILVFSLLTLGLMAMFGALYDRQVESGTTCYGQMCFYDSFIICSVLSLISFVLITTMIWREKSWRKSVR